MCCMRSSKKQHNPAWSLPSTSRSLTTDLSASMRNHTAVHTSLKVIYSGTSSQVAMKSRDGEKLGMNVSLINASLMAVPTAAKRSVSFVCRKKSWPPESVVSMSPQKGAIRITFEVNPWRGNGSGEKSIKGVLKDKCPCVFTYKATKHIINGSYTL